ncbi:helix-turn-helix transcriptional regulator [Acidaminobacter sp. JC074]|uniref:AraC family transcriptional regulator n=1 Tax=Acidaminobacter sp. JC074 TaxID=2530199 RepID=UPI001F0CE38B|nr:AraC family transcriptional regulator [Acidaminobacter sp. JC074]MCH4891032.1 helix-turn-helix transcriptional regulator [Acidaminobacter sp. JC074]
MNSITINTPLDYFEVLTDKDFFDTSTSTNDVYRLNPNYGHGTVERVVLSEGVELAFMDMTFHKDVIYEYEIPVKFFEFAYCIEGRLTYGHYDRETHITINPGDTFYWINGSDKGWIKYHKNTRYNMIAIIYRDYFFNGLVEKSDEIKKIMFSTDKKSYTGFIKSSELILCFNQILFCKEEDKSLHKYMYLYSKVYEMAAIFLKENKTMQHIKSSLKLSKEDKDKIFEAKELVENNLVNPYSIEDLSRKVGLNTFKLKSGFKEMHQNTVFGYLRVCRMKKARRCLECSDCTVLEVANKVGYSNPSHFSVAFKKIYGVFPSELRNGVIKLPDGVESCSQ